MKSMLIAVLCLASLPTFAADAKACEAFGTALDKGSKAGGHPMDADSLAFFKKNCLKKPDAEVKKDTSCLSAVKNEADLKKCLK